MPRLFASLPTRWIDERQRLVLELAQLRHRAVAEQVNLRVGLGVEVAHEGLRHLERGNQAGRSIRADAGLERAPQSRFLARGRLLDLGVGARRQDDHLVVVRQAVHPFQASARAFSKREGVSSVACIEAEASRMTTRNWAGLAFVAK